MNGRCETCERESLCAYPYKPTECCDMRKFQLRKETLVERATRLGVETATVGEMLDEIERLRGKLAILRDSAKDVISWCDKTGSGDALYCIDRLRHAIAATEPPNAEASGRAA